MRARATVMPALAFAIARAVGLNDLHTVGLLLVGCCPGGTMSNALVYFAQADLPLSVSCTLISNTLSIGTLPLLLYLWGQGLTTLSIPYADVAASMALVIVPTLMGVLLKQASARYAAWGETFGAVLGAVMIVSSIFAGILGNVGFSCCDGGGDGGWRWSWWWSGGCGPSSLSFESLCRYPASLTPHQQLDTLQDPELLPATTWIACGLLPFGGGFIVFCTGLVVSLGSREAVALLIEVSQQNIPLATAIVNIAFANGSLTSSRLFQIQLFPVIYGLVASSEMVIVVVISRYFNPSLVEDGGGAEGVEAGKS